MNSSKRLPQNIHVLSISGFSAVRSECFTKALPISAPLIDWGVTDMKFRQQTVSFLSRNFLKKEEKKRETVYRQRVSFLSHYWCVKSNATVISRQDGGGGAGGEGWGWRGGRKTVNSHQRLIQRSCDSKSVYPQSWVSRSLWQHSK